MTSFISILLSFNAIKALVPVMIIGALIAAAAGLSRGKSLFAMFGVGTALGSASISGGKKVLGKNIEKQKGEAFGGGKKLIKKARAARAGGKFYKNEISGKRPDVNRSGSLFDAKRATALGLGTTVTYIGELPKQIGLAVAKEKEMARLKSNKDKAKAKVLIQQDSEIRKGYDDLEMYRNTIAANSIKMGLEKRMMHSNDAETAKRAKIEYRKLKTSQISSEKEAIELGVTLISKLGGGKSTRRKPKFMVEGIKLGILNRDDVIDIYRHLDAQIESLNTPLRKGYGPKGNYGIYSRTSEKRTENFYEMDKMTKRRQHKIHSLKK